MLKCDGFAVVMIVFWVAYSGLKNSLKVTSLLSIFLIFPKDSFYSLSWCLISEMSREIGSILCLMLFWINLRFCFTYTLRIILTRPESYWRFEIGFETGLKFTIFFGIFKSCYFGKLDLNREGSSSGSYLIFRGEAGKL